MRKTKKRKGHSHPFPSLQSTCRPKDEFHAFISYAAPDRDLAANLRGRLGDYGIGAWMYERDKTLGAVAWKEIERQLRTSRILLAMISRASDKSYGQKREFRMCVERIRKEKSAEFLVPLVLDDLEFSELPKALRSLNGERLDCFNIQSVTQDLAHRFFPEVVGQYFRHGFVCPQAGWWLEVAKIDPWIEDGFEVGDLLYFRQLSPMGLFECYSPKLDQPVWIDRSNVRPTARKVSEELVPLVYRVGTMFDMYLEGWRAWCERNPDEDPVRARTALKSSSSRTSRTRRRSSGV